MKKSGFIFLMLIVLNSCSLSQAKNKVLHTEVVEVKSVFFPATDQQFQTPVMTHKQKIWYKDSMAIEEVTSLSIHEDEKNVMTITNPILYYRFTNLKTKNSYQYLSFSDTATIEAKFSLYDTTGTVGGWSFLMVRKPSYRGSPLIMPDTIIDNTKYNRVTIFMGTEKVPQVMTYYCRCDKQGTVFNYNPSVSKIVGCPATMKKDYFPLKNDMALSSEIVFLADTLTEKEQKVFEAWQRNEIENPVKRKKSSHNGGYFKDAKSSGVLLRLQHQTQKIVAR